MKKRPINWETSKLITLIEAYQSIEGPGREAAIVEAVRRKAVELRFSKGMQL